MACLIVLSFFFASTTLLGVVPRGSTLALSQPEYAQATDYGSPTDGRTKRFTTPTLDENALLQQSLNDATERLKTLQASLDALTQKQQDLTELNTQLQKDKVALQATVDATQAQVKTLTASQSDLQAQLIAAAGDTKTAQALKDQLSDAQAQIKALTAAQSDLQAKLSAALSTPPPPPGPSVDDVKKAQEDLAAAQAQVKTLTATQSDLQAQLAATADDSKTIQALKDQLAVATQAQTTLQAKADDLSKQLAAMHAASISTDSAATQVAALSDQVDSLKRENDDLASERDTLQQQLEALQGGLVKSTSSSKALAEDQWNALFRSLTTSLSPVKTQLGQMCTAMTLVATRVHEVVAGRTKALTMYKQASSDLVALQTKFTALSDADAKVSGLTAANTDLTSQVAHLTSSLAEKGTQLDTLNGQLQDLKSQLDAANKAMDELKAEQVTSAGQLRAQLVTLKQIMSSFLAQVQRQLSAIGQALSPMSDVMAGSKDNDKKMRALSLSLKGLDANVRELMDLAKETSVPKHATKGIVAPTSVPSSSAADQATIKQLSDQLATITQQYKELVQQYNQVVKDANDQIQMLQAQITSLKSSASDSDAVKAELARLQKQLDADQQQRDIDARIASQVRDATVSAKLDALTAQQSTARLDALRDQQITAATTSAQLSAGSAYATGIAAVAATKSSGSGSVMLNLADPRTLYGAPPSASVIQGMPAAFQPSMSSLARLPIYSTTPPRTMTTYLSVYQKVISFLTDPKNQNNRDSFNRLEGLLYNAVASEANSWYKMGIASSSAAVKTQAINNLKALYDQIALPLQRLNTSLVDSGAGNYVPPEDIAARIVSLRRALGDRSI